RGTQTLSARAQDGCRRTCAAGGRESGVQRLREHGRNAGQSAYQPTISIVLKKKRISSAAVSGESEPCTELASIFSAKSLLIVPGAAFAGSVAPMISRFLATALSPSSTWTTTGPEVMNSHRLPKNGRALWTP